ncbi:GntR family transcriptional regulator [Pseudomonas aeruginosa]|nr:GntR family transcriptional regulator [Pseudomonas aeruginosa]
MAVIGRFNSLQVVKHTEFGLYLDGTQHGEILLPKRYVPKDQPSEVGDWLNVFIYLDRRRPPDRHHPGRPRSRSAVSPA